MYLKFVGLVVLIGLAKQSFASPFLNQNAESVNYFDHADTAQLAIISDSKTVVRSFAYCKDILYDIALVFGKSIKLLVGFISEAREYYGFYKDCNEGTENGAALNVCQEAVKYEYFDAVKSRANNFIKSIKGIISEVTKLPRCLFKR